MKMATSCCGKFVSQKIRRIRWKLVPPNVLQKPDIFVAGSWQNEVNKLSVWQLPQPEPTNSDDALAANDPKLLNETVHNGDVTDLKYITHDTFVASSSNGSVSLYKQVKNQAPRIQMVWEKTHHLPVDLAPCTGIDNHGENLVSVGEDGRVIQYNVKINHPIRIIDADSCTLTAVAYLKQNEIIASNTQGQLALWDLRASDQPARLLFMGGEQTALLCMAHHPTQPSTLICGGEDGTLCIWDLRQERFPVTLLSAHDGPVLEMKLHPLSPNHLFTCSMDGMIWHWDSSTLASTPISTSLVKRPTGGAPSDVINPWLACGASKHHLEICSLIPSSHKPINSLDILQDVLLCGSDNEAFYIISNLTI